MNTYLILFLVIAVVNVAGFLWLAIVAFKRGVGWGILVLLLSPIGAIVFSLMNWFDARKAFLLYIVSFLLFNGSLVYIIGKIGVGNMQQILAQVNSRKIDSREAYQLLAKAMLHDNTTGLLVSEPKTMQGAASVIADAKPMTAQAKTVAIADKVATSPVADSAPASQTKMQARHVTKPASKDKPALVHKKVVRKSQVKNKAKPEELAGEQINMVDGRVVQEEPVPSLNEVQPDPLAQKPFKPAPDTIVVRLDRVSHYIGHYFIITLKSGITHRGLLRKVGHSTLFLDRKLYGGNFEYRVIKRDISRIRMLKKIPEQEQ